MDVRSIAFFAGIIIGSIAILAVAFVWIRKQTFGVGGSVLCSVGVVLLGLSVWTTMKIEISQQGISWEFQRQLATVLEANQALTEEVQVLARNNEAAREQLSALTNTLQETRVLDVQRAEQLRQPMQATPNVNLQRLERVDEALRRARSEMQEQ